MSEKLRKEHIVSFRISNEQHESLTRMLEEQPIVGLKSVNQFFRKVGRDFMAGKIVYKDPQDLLEDIDPGR